MPEPMGNGGMSSYGTPPQQQYGGNGAPQMGQGQTQMGAVQVPPRQQPAAARKPITQIHLDELLEIVIERNSSDLHIAPGIPPIIRVDGALQPTPYENATPLDVQQMMYSILTDEQIQRFRTMTDLPGGRTRTGCSLPSSSFSASTFWGGI